jgi:hypothetical protein
MRDYLLGALVVAVCMNSPDKRPYERITAAAFWPIMVYGSVEKFFAPKADGNNP